MDKKQIAGELMKIAKSLTAEYTADDVDEKELDKTVIDELNPVDMDEGFQRSQEYQSALEKWIDDQMEDGEVYQFSDDQYYNAREVDKLAEAMADEMNEAEKEGKDE